MGTLKSESHLPDPSTPARFGNSDTVFLRRLVWAILILGVVWLLFRLADLLLLVFGAVLIATIFRALADAIAGVTRLSERWSLLAAILLTIAVVVLSGWLFGAQIRAQVSELQETLPRAWDTFEAWIGDTGLGERLLESAREWSPSAGVMRNVGTAAKGTVEALANLLLVVAGGIYLAAQPRVYRRGLLQLLPPRSRDAGRDAVAATGVALRQWLQAQLIGMVAIGAFTTLGLWIIGVPSALPLGLLAGLAEFVPIVGPILAAIPALLIAATIDRDTLLWTLGLYIVIQQIEGSIIMPLVTRHAVQLPPAVALFSVFALGILFGPLGVLFAAPLAVVVFVLVGELYVKRALGGPPPGA